MKLRSTLLNWPVFALSCMTGALSTSVVYAVESTTDTQRIPADNSGKNARDRTRHAVTADSQMSGSRSDLEITREIRQEIQRQDAFSTSAKNVKIITQRGMVTLRGPVASSEERMQIARIAKDCAGVTRVSNDLEVKR